MSKLQVECLNPSFTPVEAESVLCILKVLVCRESLKAELLILFVPCAQSRWLRIIYKPIA